MKNWQSEYIFMKGGDLAWLPGFSESCEPQYRVDRSSLSEYNLNRLVEVAESFPYWMEKEFFENNFLHRHNYLLSFIAVYGLVNQLYKGNPFLFFCVTVLDPRLADLPDIPNFDEEALVAIFIAAKPPRVLLSKVGDNCGVVRNAPDGHDLGCEVVPK